MIGKKRKNKITKQGFAQGILALLFSQILIKILGLFYKLYLTNKSGFGDAGNAIYSSGFQIYALLLTISSIGVPNAVAKLVSERVSIGDYRGAHRIFKIAFATFAIIGFIGALLLFIGAPIIANEWLQIPEAELTLVCLSPSIFFVAIISVLRGYFNGRGSMEATANSQTIEQLCKTVCTILLVEMTGIVLTKNSTLTLYMAAAANFATTLATIISFFYLWVYYKERRSEIGKEIRKTKNGKAKKVKNVLIDILKVSLPMSFSSILTTINKNIDSVTVVRGLKNFLTAEQAKVQYGILSGKVDTLTTLPLSFNIALATVLVPDISSAMAVNNRKKVKERIEFSLLISILIGLPCTIGMIVFAKPILNLLFPNANTGAFIFQIGATSIFWIVIEQTIHGALQGMGKVMIPAVGLTIGVGVKFLLNQLLVPINPDTFLLGGAAGAAFATTICHMIAVVFSSFVLKKQIKLSISIKQYIVKPVLVSFGMIFLSYSLYFILKGIIVEKLATIISLLFAVIVYGIMIFIMKIFSKEQLYILPFGEKIYNILRKIKIYSES